MVWASGRTRILFIAGGVLLALGIWACADEIDAAPPLVQVRGPVTLVVDRASYSPGQELKVTLNNDSPGEVGYNLCFAFLKLQWMFGNGWETVAGAYLGPPSKETTDCTSDLRLLGAGQSAGGSAHLPDDLAEGTYRLTHDVEVGNDRREIATDGFTVVR